MRTPHLRGPHLKALQTQQSDSQQLDFMATGSAMHNLHDTIHLARSTDVMHRKVMPK